MVGNKWTKQTIDGFILRHSFRGPVNVEFIVQIVLGDIEANESVFVIHLCHIRSTSKVSLPKRNRIKFETNHTLDARLFWISLCVCPVTALFTKRVSKFFKFLDFCSFDLDFRFRVFFETESSDN